MDDMDDYIVIVSASVFDPDVKVAAHSFQFKSTREFFLKTWAKLADVAGRSPGRPASVLTRVAHVIFMGGNLCPDEHFPRSFVLCTLDDEANGSVDLAVVLGPRCQVKRLLLRSGGYGIATGFCADVIDVVQGINEVRWCPIALQSRIDVVVRRSRRKMWRSSKCLNEVMPHRQTDLLNEGDVEKLDGGCNC
jgi:hypothetical protein